jgi:F-type H+-transporting ATPase subunit b
MRGIRSTPWIMSAALVALPSLTIAASGGTHHEGPPTAGQWLLMLFTFVNFAVFAYLFVRFTGTPLREFLQGRRREVVNLMAEAERAKTEAERLRREFEAKSAALEQTKRDLIAEVRAIAEADRQRMLAAAKEASDRLIRDAERAAQSDIERARRELRAEAAKLATEIASAEVAKRIDEPARRRLLDEFLAGVSRK